MARTVTFTVRHPDDTPWVGAVLYFRLSPDDYSSTIQYPSDALAATATIADGTGSIDLWQNALGAESTLYECTLPTGETFTFEVPAGTSDIALSTLRGGAFPSLVSGGNFSLSGYDDLADAISEIGATEGTLLIDVSDTLTANVTVPSTLQLLWLAPNNIIDVDTYTLTVASSIEAGLFQILDTSGGTLTISGKVKQLWPQWIGNAGDAPGAFTTLDASGLTHIGGTATAAEAPHANYDNLTIEGAGGGNAGLTISTAVAANGGIAFGDDSNTAATLLFAHADDEMRFSIGGNRKLTLGEAMALGVSPVDYIQLKIGGSFTSGGATNHAIGQYFNTALTGDAGDSLFLAGSSFSGGSITLAGNTTDVATVRIGEPDIDLDGNTATNAASLLITGAPTEGGTTNNAIRVVSGTSYFGGTVGIGVAADDHPLQVTGSRAGAMVVFDNTVGANPYGLSVDFSAASPDDNTRYFFKGEDSTAARVYLYSDGDGLNADGTWGAISDMTLKQDIEPAKSQWEDVKAISKMAINYDLKDGKRRLLGWAAQDVEQVSPGLVMHCDEGDESFLGLRTSIMHTKAFIALGEALEKIEELETRLAALEAV